MANLSRTGLCPPLPAPDSHLSQRTSCFRELPETLCAGAAGQLMQNACPH